MGPVARLREVPDWARADAAPDDGTPIHALRTRFRVRGWVALDGVLDTAALDALDRASQRHWQAQDIADKPGTPGWAQHPARDLPDGVAPQQLFRPEGADMLRRLFGGSAQGMRSGLGPQYTYAFPAPGARGLGPHIDGDLGDGRVSLMDGLVGILLHDVADASLGAFLVVEGSHRRNARFLRAHRSMPILAALRAVNSEVHDPARITAFLGPRGRIIACHPLLSHGTGPNSAGAVRRMAFIRIHARLVAERDGGLGGASAAMLLGQDPAERGLAARLLRMAIRRDKEAGRH